MYDCNFSLRQYDQLLMSLTQRVNSLTESYNSIIPNNNLPIFLQDFTAQSSTLKINWTTVALNPSNESGNRIWNIVGNSAVLDSNTTSFTIVYNFTQVESGYTISFEGIPSGTLNYGELSLNASLYTIVDYNYEAKTITVIISDLPVKENTSTTSLKLYWNLFLDDTSSNSTSTTGSATVVFTTSYTALAESVDGINTPSYISLYYYYLSNFDYGILNIISASATTNTIYLNSYTSGSSQLQILSGGSSSSITIENENGNTYEQYFNQNQGVLGTLYNSGSALQTTSTCNGIVINFLTTSYNDGNNLNYYYGVDTYKSPDNGFYITGDFGDPAPPIYLYFINIEPNVNLTIMNAWSLNGWGGKCPVDGNIPSVTVYVFGLTNNSSPNTVNNPSNNTFYSTTLSQCETVTGTFDSNGNFSINT